MRNLLLTLLLVCPVAHADSWVAVVNGPSWHATSDALNWRTFGAGMGYSRGSYTVAIGGYDNSNHRHSTYLALQWLQGRQWVYGGTLALTTGYPFGRIMPIPLVDIGYRIGSGTLVFGVVPPNHWSPAVVNAQFQVNF
jgi:hypothetical protein